MKIAFFEITELEKKRFSESLTNYELLFFDDIIQNVDTKEFNTCDIICTFIYSKVSEDILKDCPNLKAVLTRSTGTDHIAVNYCKENNVSVKNVPQYGENTVAEHTMALLLSISRRIGESLKRIRKDGEFSTVGLQGFDLKGKTIGLIGCGRIGLHVAKMAKGFGMNVIVTDLNPDSFVAEVVGYSHVTLDKLLKTADIISLHAPYNEGTHHIINEESINKMKDGVVIINTARGGLIDQASLLKAIDSGKIGGAGLDVVEGEAALVEETIFNSPVAGAAKIIKQNQQLMANEKIIVTPHNAFNSLEAVNRIIATTIQNIRSV